MPEQISLRQSISPAFRQLPVEQESFARFRQNLRGLIDQLGGEERSEENYKDKLKNFLVNTFYGLSDDRAHWCIEVDLHKMDLVIAQTVSKGKQQALEVGVIFEVKKPTNLREMPTKKNLNVKALQQAVYYFMQERLSRENARVKHLVITNIYEWFIFEAQQFEQLFVKDTAFKREFLDFEAGRLSYRNREDFYQGAVSRTIAQHLDQLRYVYFDVRDWSDWLVTDEATEQAQYLERYRVFAPEHLFGLSFANDSNTLDKQFYGELLHILGLAEQKTGNTKTIQRLPEAKRDRGSLLENAMLQIDRLGKLKRLENPEAYGETKEERLFNTALQLVIVWLNRILFLKLLESQLLAYHKNQQCYRFLTLEKLPDYDELSALFFHVLALKLEDRDETVSKWETVPYLNSSLFETTELELQLITIDSLRGSLMMRVFERTILRDEQNSAKKRSGLIAPLEYLLKFLDAYDFGSVGEGEIRAEQKTLISASVLGLVFEKINGYQDGAFFTPGYVTMYMCREILRQAVIAKFNQVKGWQCRSLVDVYNKIDDKAEANGIINQLKICDPSVGSGHFLVSALNELITIKSELKILQDEEGLTLRDYQVRVENDELIVTNEDGSLFRYHPQSRESLRVQKTLFHEKRFLIENCLFGVDINPNSVAICRLRLWIELLKNAYYRDDALTRLETLPNIDINIKQGNSVISRYSLDLDLAPLLRKTGYTIEQYRAAIASYQSATSRDEKYELEAFIAQIKADLVTEISVENELLKKRADKEKEWVALRQPIILSTGDVVKEQKEREARQKKEAKLKQEIEVLTQKIEEFKSGVVYRGAMEWRFEFPEILSLETGEFVGFDVVVGNPPYVRQEQIKQMKPLLQARFSTYTGVADLFVYFYELGLNLLNSGGFLTFISSNKYFRAGYGKELRRLLAEETTIASLIDFGDYPVFEEAIAYPSIITLRKGKPAADQVVRALSWDGSRSDDVRQFGAVLESSGLDLRQSELMPDGWRLESGAVLDLLAKLRGAGVPLGEYVEGRFYRGILTGFNEAFVVDRVTRDRLVEEDARSAEVLKPFLRGKDVKRWSVQFADQYLIKIESSENKKHPWSDKLDQEAEQIFKETYPAIWTYMNQYRDQLIKRSDQGKYFWELRSCKYWDAFLGKKILYPDIYEHQSFAFSDSELFFANTGYFIPNGSYFLCGVLNSYLTEYFYANISNRIRGGYLRAFSDYMKQIPIPDPKKDPKRVQKIESLVEEILSQKQSNPAANVRELEKQIDDHVYQLYDLTPGEIAIIETTIKP